jgi:hypothetical protein
MGRRLTGVMGVLDRPKRLYTGRQHESEWLPAARVGRPRRAHVQRNIRVLLSEVQGRLKLKGRSVQIELNFLCRVMGYHSRSLAEITVQLRGLLLLLHLTHIRHCQMLRSLPSQIACNRYCVSA